MNRRLWFQNLPELRLIGEPRESPGVTVFPVEAADEPGHCPYCKQSVSLCKYGTRIQTVMDEPIKSKPVELQLVRKRYRCRECGVTFWENLQCIDPTRKMTKRLVQAIKRLSLFKNYSEIAVECGIHEKTVRNCIKQETG